MSPSYGRWGTALGYADVKTTTYMEGVSGIVLIGGWVIGDYFAWLAGIPRALRKRSEEIDAVTIPSFLGWGIPGGRIVVIIAGFICE